jgi:hypothetical protein
VRQTILVVAQREPGLRAPEQVWREREIAKLGQPPAGVLDVFVDAEDLVQDDDSGAGAGGRQRDVRAHLAAVNLDVLGAGQRRHRAAGL